MSKLPDPFREGLARGWKATNGEAGLPQEIQCDVAIVGSGAGAGITAELLTKAGLDVVLIEEGPLQAPAATSTRKRPRPTPPSTKRVRHGRRTIDNALDASCKVAA